MDNYQALESSFEVYMQWCREYFFNSLNTQNSYCGSRGLWALAVGYRRLYKAAV